MNILKAILHRKKKKIEKIQELIRHKRLRLHKKANRIPLPFEKGQF